MTAKFFPPSDFLDLAKKLCSTNVDEASVRTIMNRCYYAIFLMLREKFGLPVVAKHKKVYDKTKSKSGTLAQFLDILWTYRRGADYFLKNPSNVRGRRVVFKIHFTQGEAVRCINIAQRAISLISTV